MRTGISQAARFRCKKECAGRLPSEMKRLSQFKDGNARLKKIVAT